jgi:predicted Zn-dependent peptidase
LEFELFTFNNGIRFAYKQSEHTQIAHSGIFINAGSRDERIHEIGIAHLLEHMLFKGTFKRNSRQVLNRLEVVGGDLNAFTTKDKTVIHASVVKDHFERAMELLADVTFNSSFPTRELVKEKKVIYEEIDMYLDAPEEKIFDEFQEMLYDSHPLGNNILGSKKSIEQLSSDDLNDFVKNTYFANQIIVVAVAPIPIKKALRICKKYIEGISLPSGTIERLEPVQNGVFNLVRKNHFSQAHGLLGGHAYPLNHQLRPALMLLTNMLGGPGLNSLLNLDLREKRAYTYGVDCNYQALTDSGFFTIYWSTELKNIRKSKKVILNMMNDLASSRIKESQLKTYKTQFQGQMIMGEESNSSLMFVIGRSLLDLGSVESLKEILDKVNDITAEDMRLVAEELFKEKNLSFLTYEPSAH